MTDLLPISLSAAVPIWIHKVRQNGRVAWEARMADKSAEWSQALAERGDRLLYRSKKAGETAELFNILAECLAHMAFVPGGVKSFGSHWEARFDD